MIKTKVIVPKYDHCLRNSKYGYLIDTWLPFQRSRETK